MPNTLAHFAVQGPLTQLALRQADARWVVIGCVVPDIPWILRRAIGSLGLPVDPYSLRLYAIVLSSLLFCLIVSALIAALSVRRSLLIWGSRSSQYCGLRYRRRGCLGGGIEDLLDSPQPALEFAGR